MKHPLVPHELQQQADADVSQRMMPLIQERAAETPALLPPKNGW
jgi:hypothetical protein